MKLFVWDFHGVLEKGNDDAVVEITNMALEQHGYSRRMTHTESTFLAGRRWHDYFAFLLPEAALEECIKLQETCLHISQNRSDIISKYIQINDHAHHVLEQIHNSDHHQILISNTHPKILDMFISMVNVGKYFPQESRFGVDAHQQKTITKKHCLEEFLTGKQFAKIVSIGDSPGDMALVDQDQGVRYLYSYPSRQHRATHCDFKITDLRDVLQELQRT